MKHVLIGEDLVLKFFSTTQYRYKEYESVYDYVPLQDLQGLPTVPTLIDYKKGFFIMMERCKGVPLSSISKEEVKKEKEWLTLQLKEHMYACLERNWIPQDVKTEHIFVNKAKKQIKLIDYGRYLSLHHPFAKMMRYSKKEWKEFLDQKVKEIIDI